MREIQVVPRFFKPPAIAPPPRQDPDPMLRLRPPMFACPEPTPAPTPPCSGPLKRTSPPSLGLRVPSHVHNAPRHDPTSPVRRPVPGRRPDQQHRRVLLQPDPHVTSARPHDRPLTHARVALRAPQRIMPERSEHPLIPRDPRPPPNTDGPGSAGPGRRRPCDATETQAPAHHGAGRCAGLVAAPARRDGRQSR
jgi:hypothetical protein